MVVLIPWIAAFCHAEEYDGGIGLEVLFEDTVCIETANWPPPRLDSLRRLDSGGLLVNASGELSGNNKDLHRDSWIIEVEGDGSASLRLAQGDGGILLTFAAIEDSPQQWLIGKTAEGDTLWSCRLEGTGEFDNNMEAYPLGGGGYVVVSHPDCWSTATYMARVSEGGDLLWNDYLITNYLLDMPEGVGEIYPRIASVRETAEGDILVCGNVREWITSPFAMYVTLLDGATGEPRWKFTNYLMGMAEILDVVGLSSGGIMAVGATAEAIYSDEGPRVAQWGDRLPLAVLLGPDGKAWGSCICEGTEAIALTGVIEADPLSGGLVILGSTSFHEPVRHLVIRALLDFDGSE